MARRGFDVVHLADLADGQWRTADDASVLTAATAANRILVSYDIATLPDLAQLWLEEGHHHSGLLILPRSINQRDVGTQLAAIESTIRRISMDTWADLLIFASLPSD
ncbi:MAG: DUF5615 family PIN-like protein [Thermomicrobiales bacterium]|nr:DUF5615 family PIN-like protein [Thermomicrobiales bacterium]